MAKKTFFIWAPIVIGLVACLLPFMVFTLQGQKYTSHLLDNYSGWPVAALLIAYSAFTRIKMASIRQMPRGLDLSMGIFVTGAALFHIIQAFSLFANAAPGSYALTKGANTIPGAGVWVLLLSGCWFIWRALSKKQGFFNVR